MLFILIDGNNKTSSLINTLVTNLFIPFYFIGHLFTVFQIICHSKMFPVKDSPSFFIIYGKVRVSFFTSSN